ncbi:hypothetical protein [Rhizobium grahamii]|uniref:Uncharacterized protein n=1 Tax=Rhizobium grahamii TaxID=1120045 RepID=A0A370KTC1_9HYPH|nr:hypothetical protein [Rhizobium grahamii]RDJ13910.1 hypothetical protein B5K06_08015 [Rhizobium grahamii]
MSAPIVTIERLKPQKVEALVSTPTFFDVIGHGLSEDIYVYISTNAGGTDDISWPNAGQPPKIRIDRASSGTDRRLPLAATPAFDAGPLNTTLYVAIKLTDRDGPFQDAKPIFELKLT